MKNIDKSMLMKKICEQIEKELISLKAAALATYQAATDEEAKPENKYDTRALEASYLAGAQALRVREIEDLLNVYRLLSLPSYSMDQTIGPAALVRLQFAQKQILVFMLPKGGGLNVSVGSQQIQVVTPASPLGEALVGLGVGDSAIVEVGAAVKEYEILEIC